MSCRICGKETSNMYFSIHGLLCENCSPSGRRDNANLVDTTPTRKVLKKEIKELKVKVKDLEKRIKQLNVSSNERW